jgi:DnaJ-class molecular chaperone
VYAVFGPTTCSEQVSVTVLLPQGLQHAQQFKAPVLEIQGHTRLRKQHWPKVLALTVLVPQQQAEPAPSSIETSSNTEDNLLVYHTVTLPVAALLYGVMCQVPHPLDTRKTIDLKIPPCTAEGQKLRLNGLEDLATEKTFAVKLTAQWPKTLSAKHRASIKAWLDDLE